MFPRQRLDIRIGNFIRNLAIGAVGREGAPLPSGAMHSGHMSWEMGDQPPRSSETIHRGIVGWSR